MSSQVLSDSETYPDDEVLSAVLGPRYGAYQSLMERATGPDLGLIPEWRFYKDGNAWLCKVRHGKKTVFWLSAWDDGLKVAFYFSARNQDGVLELDIDSTRKEVFRDSPFSGKVKPLVVSVRDGSELDDIFELARYRKKH